MSEARDLSGEIGRAIDELSGEDVIDPTRIASIVLGRIDPQRLSPELVFLGCHLQCRQLAREGLRRRYSIGNRAPEPDLFDLQDRYPCAQSDGGDQGYIRRELMSKIDVASNVDRMKASASSTLAHVDALIAWWNNRNPTDRM